MQGLKNIKTLKDFEFQDKVVFLRLDLNVPMENGKITDETRITATIPTIDYLRQHGAKIVMASHLGRPKSAEDKEYSLEPVAQKLSEHLKTEVLLLDEPEGHALKHLIKTLRRDQMILLENVRFLPGETKDSEELAEELAPNFDIYINDAFGASHRAHATIHALPKLMKNRGIGFLIEKEIGYLDQLLNNPKRPYWAILGGAKVSDKIAVIEKLLDLVDGFVIGGAMAYTFLKAMGHSVGSSLVENDKVKYAAEMVERIKARNKSLLLPVDHLITTNIKDVSGLKTTSDVNILEGYMGVDIGPKTISQFQAALLKAETIFWNGPMGIFETPEMAKGTFAIAKILAESKGTKIVGGGDSAAAAEASGYADKMTHISTGGGASLEYLQGEPLPGLEVLRYKHGR
jgi:phosphoglycerate kinase